MEVDEMDNLEVVCMNISKFDYAVENFIEYRSWPKL